MVDVGGLQPLSPCLGPTSFFTQTSPKCMPSYLSGYFSSQLVSPIENLLVVVHPDLSQAHLVPSNHTDALGEGVGALRPEHMSNHRTSDDFQLTTALPYLPQRRRGSTGLVGQLCP